jgi:hypothetical protein
VTFFAWRCRDEANSPPDVEKILRDLRKTIGPVSALERRAINLKHLPKVPNICMAPGAHGVMILLVKIRQAF